MGSSSCSHSLRTGTRKMAENFQEVRRYVLQQKELIIYYREATTESEGTTAKEWAEKNK